MRGGRVRSIEPRAHPLAGWRLETGDRLSVFARLSSSRVSRLACCGGYGA